MNFQLNAYLKLLLLGCILLGMGGGSRRGLKPEVRTPSCVFLHDPPLKPLAYCFCFVKRERERERRRPVAFDCLYRGQWAKF